MYFGKMAPSDETPSVSQTSNSIELDSRLLQLDFERDLTQFWLLKSPNVLSVGDSLPILILLQSIADAFHVIVVSYRVHFHHSSSRKLDF
jgi:hypothetical protein